MVDFDELRKIEDRNQRYRQALEVFTKTREEAGRRVALQLKANESPFSFVASELGYSPAGFNRRLQNGFGYRPHTVVHLAYEFLEDSCHQTFFGERGVTVLPRLESCLAHTMERLPDDALMEIYLLATRLFQQDEETSSLFCQHDDTGLVRARVLEQCTDRCVQPVNLLGTDECKSAKLNLRKFGLEEFESYIPQTQVIMYFAFSLNTSLDYFMAPDYTKYTALCCSDDPKRTVIQSGMVIKILGKFLVLSPESRKALASKVFTRYWKH